MRYICCMKKTEAHVEYLLKTMSQAWLASKMGMHSATIRRRIVDGRWKKHEAIYIAELYRRVSAVESLVSC